MSMVKVVTPAAAVAWVSKKPCASVIPLSVATVPPNGVNSTCTPASGPSGTPSLPIATTLTASGVGVPGDTWAGNTTSVPARTQRSNGTVALRAGSVPSKRSE
jgi:hypothetical protein